MAVENDEDRAMFFDPDDFGGIAVVTIDGGEPFDIEGIYDAPHFIRGVKQDNQFSSNQSVDNSGSKPLFRTRSTLLAGVKNGRATIVIHEPWFAAPTPFSVFDVGPDGTGMTALKLMKG